MRCIGSWWANDLFAGLLQMPSAGIRVVSQGELGRLALPSRDRDRKRIAAFARAASDEDVMFPPDLLERVKRVRRKTVPKREMQAIRARIIAKVGKTIPDGPRQRNGLIKRLIALYDHWVFENTLEDGLSAWSSHRSGRKVEFGCQLSQTHLDQGIAGLTELDSARAGITLDMDSILDEHRRKASTVGNLSCQSEMMCGLLLQEHELVHLFNFLFDGKLIDKHGVHSHVFANLNKRLFGHNSVNHNL
jgi:hypothetical protein